MQKNISPEEKLLSIIKGRHKRPDAEDAPTNKGNEPKSKTSRLKNKMDEYLSIALKNNFLKNNLFDPKVLRIFDKYMVIVLCLAFFYLIIDMLFANSSKKAEFIISKISTSGARTPFMEKAAPIETKSYSHYSNKISGRKLFTGSSYAPSGPEEEQGSSGEGSPANLGLVGIVPGDKTQAIIEDKKSQKTYYLIKGQSADNITVDDISQGSVILDYKGKKITLFL